MHATSWPAKTSWSAGTFATGVGAAVAVGPVDATDDALGLAPFEQAARMRRAAIAPIAPFRGEMSMPVLRSDFRAANAKARGGRLTIRARRVHALDAVSADVRITLHRVTATDPLADQPLAPRTPLPRASTLPSRYYLDPATYASEVERIFGRSWQLVARADELARPGDFVPVTVVNEPVVITHG